MKVDSASNPEQNQTQIPVASNSSPAPTKHPKVSMFGSKIGFVIPKNKLSGSLVPIFRDTKKPKGSDEANDESTKQGKRKTKWGPDLTQDAFLRKGRSLAYQTRVDQIMEQLKLRNLETEEDNASILAATDADEESLTQELDFQLIKPEQLEHERCEVIGEILNVNPKYRTPPGYKPLLREARVFVPIKEYPQYNFLGIIFGSGSDTQKRLEKETGAKIQVFGSKRDSTEKVEILSDEKESHDAYHEIYVLISAETYHKVDAAVSLIELLVTPVSGRQAVQPPSTSGKDTDVIAPSQDVGTSSLTNQITEQQVLGTNHTTSQAQFQYSSPWFPTGSYGLQSPSSFPPPNPSAYALNSSAPQSSPVSSMPTPHGLHATAATFGPAISTPSAYMSGQMGPSRYPPMAAPQQLPVQSIVWQAHQSSGNLSTQVFPTSPGRPFMSSLPQHVPNLPPGPLHSVPGTPAGNSTGWSGLVTARSASQFSSNMDGPSLSSVLTPQVGVSQVSAAAFPPPASVSSVQLPILSYNQIPMQGSFPREPVPIPSFSPVTGSGPLSSALPVLGSGNTPNFTSMRAPASTTLRPQVPVASDFTFQPQQPHHSGSPMNNWPGGHPLARGAATQPGFMANSQLFASGMPNPAPQPFVTDLPRPLFGNQSSQTLSHFSIRNPSVPNPSRFPVFPDSNPTTPMLPMGPRNFIPSHQRPNLSSPYPRPGHDMQFQQNFSSRGPLQGHFPVPNQFHNNVRLPSGMPAVGPSGGQQVYDPFSPTSSSLVHQQQIGNLGNMRKQENDPEYEDLMSSVGVK